MNRVKVSIREFEDGWCLVAGDETGTSRFDSAGDALEFAKSLGERLAPSIVEVEWHPISSIGAAAVRALQS